MIKKEIQEGEENSRIIGQVFANKIKRAMQKESNFAEDLVKELEK